MSDKQREQKELSERYMEAVSNKGRKDAGDYITQFYEAVKDVPLKKVPENVFREVFLPYMTGEEKATHDHNPIAHWTGLVGGPTLPAAVVGIDGTTLFIVPPMYDSSKIDTRKTGKGPDRFNRLFMDLQDESRSRPVQAAEKWAEGMAAETATIVERLSPSTYSWDPVFEYYQIGKEKSQEGVPAQNTRPSDDKFDDNELEF